MESGRGQRHTPHGSVRAVNTAAGHRAAKPPARRLAIQVVVAVSIIIAGSLMLVRSMQDRLMFSSRHPATSQGAGGVRMTYETADQQPVYAFAVEPAAAAGNAPSPGLVHRVVLAFHGYSDIAGSWIPWAQEVASRTGWPVVLAEYRGYGGLSGAPDADAMMRDARAALSATTARYKVDASNVTLFGHALGSGVATQLASERRVRAVVLEAPMSSLKALSRRAFSPPLSWMLSLVSRNEFAPAEGVRTVAVPVWVAAGERDRLIPPAMARKVFDAARVRGEFLLVPGASHGSLSERGGADYWAWLTRALGAADSSQAN